MIQGKSLLPPVIAVAVFLVVTALARVRLQNQIGGSNKLGGETLRETYHEEEFGAAVFHNGHCSHRSCWTCLGMTQAGHADDAANFNGHGHGKEVELRVLSSPPQYVSGGDAAAMKCKP